LEDWQEKSNATLISTHVDICFYQLIDFPNVLIVWVFAMVVLMMLVSVNIAILIQKEQL
jgi:hypothetical protein